MASAFSSNSASGSQQQGGNQGEWTVHSVDVTRGSLGPHHPAHEKFKDVGWSGSGDSGNTQPASADSQGQSSSKQESFPYPSLSLPAPGLKHEFRMSVTLNPRISVGSTPFGHRNWISFTGGSWTGSFGSGVVLPGGQDSQLIVEDGSAKLETNYILQSSDEPPAYFVIKTKGWRTGPPEVLEALADPTRADSVDPSQYFFRLFIDMETGDERYQKQINHGMWVGSGMRKGAEVIYDAYRVT